MNRIAISVLLIVLALFSAFSQNIEGKVITRTFSDYAVDPDLNNPLKIQRYSSNNECLNIWLNDTYAHFFYKNDESMGGFSFDIFNSDTESGGGAQANSQRIIEFFASQYGPQVRIGGGKHIGGYTLSVNGSMAAKEIIVTEAGWADYVFNPDYQLKTLDEVQQFINQKGHLPDVPNEKQVSAEGVSLGEMNRILLQKIEELTLYVIAQEKQISLLSTRVSEQAVQINALCGGGE